MRIKMEKGDKEWRIKALNSRDWDTMVIQDNTLYIIKGSERRAYILTKKHETRLSDFNYDFVKRLIENAEV